MQELVKGTSREKEESNVTLLRQNALLPRISNARIASDEQEAIPAGTFRYSRLDVQSSRCALQGTSAGLSTTIASRAPSCPPRCAPARHQKRQHRATGGGARRRRPDRRSGSVREASGGRRG